MRRFASQLGVKVVGCQDAHYVDRDDVEAHEGIWAIRTYNTFDDPIKGGPQDNVEGQKYRPYYSTREYWLKDAHHMLYEPLTTEDGVQRATSLFQSEIEESAAIADRIGDVVIEKKLHLPRYEFLPDHDQTGCSAAKECIDIQSEPKDMGAFNYLCELVMKGYEQRYQCSWFDRTDEHRERLSRELRDIKDAGLADYFLIIWDIVTWARAQGIATGTGRGSSAGSMVSYCIGITGVEPLQYGLLWERFYNAGRKGSLADIDLDFSQKDRKRVVDYIKERFGTNRVAQIVTFNTLGSKAVLKDTAKILGSQGGMDYDDANVMTRYVPLKHGQAVSLKEALEESDKIKEYAEKYPRLFRIAQKLEGCPKNRGTHAAGVVISDEPFENGFPLSWNTREETMMTEWDMDTLDSLGYLKVDVLGLKTLDVLDDIEKQVNGVE
jgi:DNA polymerase-3 subunit alpha